MDPVRRDLDQDPVVYTGSRLNQIKNARKRPGSATLSSSCSSSLEQKVRKVHWKNEIKAHVFYRSYSYKFEKKICKVHIL